jgi:HlyD family secretion protein
MSARLFVVASALLALTLGACGGGDAAAAGPTMRVARGTLVERAAASGTIAPDRQVEIRSRASGEVLEVLVAEGDVVEEGALLVRLDTTDAARSLRDAEATVRRLRAEVSASRASLTIAEGDAESAAVARSISERGTSMGLISGEADRDSARAAASAAGSVTLENARLASARASLDTAMIAAEVAEETLGRAEIRAPFAGTVLSVEVERGTIVASALNSVSGGTALLTLADLTDLRIIGQLDESQIASVAVGQDVGIRVDAYPTREFTGRVERVSPLAYEINSVIVFDVEIVVTDADRALLRSGMSADVQIVTQRHEEALLVPLASLRSTGPTRAVFSPDGTRHEIVTGPTDGTMIVVLEGISEGDEILESPPSESGGAARGGLFPSPGPRSGSGGSGRAR